MAEVNEFNLNYLQKKIDELKEETNQTSEYTIEYLQCLIDAHELHDSIPDDFEFDEIPDHIIDKLKQGVVPSEEDFLPIDPYHQFMFRTDVIFLCGMRKLARLGGDEVKDGCENSMFDIVNTMMNASPSYCGGAYILLAMVLLHSVVPSPAIVEMLTCGFSDSEEDLAKSASVFHELADTILEQYKFQHQ